MQLCPNDLGNKDALWIESDIDPHAEPSDSGIDREAAEVAEVQPLPPPPSVMKSAGRVRITRQDLVKHGFSKDCRLCVDLEAGKHFTEESHSEECRLRIFSEWESHKDPKWGLARRELQFEEIGTSLPPANAEIEGLENLDTRKPKAGIPHPKSTETAAAATICHAVAGLDSCG